MSIYRRRPAVRKRRTNGPRSNGGSKFTIANGSGPNKKWWSCPTRTITADCHDVTDQVNINNIMNQPKINNPGS